VASTALPTPEATIATRPPTAVSERMIWRLSARVSTTMNSSSTTARLAASQVKSRLAQMRLRLRRKIAAACEGGAHRETAGADMPFRFGAERRRKTGSAKQSIALVERWIASSLCSSQ
jgi:hypothetical protein